MEIDFTNLFVVAAIAFLAPLLLGFAPALRLPAIVLELVAGIVAGGGARLGGGRRAGPGAVDRRARLPVPAGWPRDRLPQLEVVSPTNAAALVAAGLLSVVTFPAAALTLLKRDAQMHAAVGSG